MQQSRTPMLVSTLYVLACIAAPSTSGLKLHHRKLTHILKEECYQHGVIYIAFIICADDQLRTLGSELQACKVKGSLGDFGCSSTQGLSTLQYHKVITALQGIIQLYFGTDRRSKRTFRLHPLHFKSISRGTARRK